MIQNIKLYWETVEKTEDKHDVVVLHSCPIESEELLDWKREKENELLEMENHLTCKALLPREIKQTEKRIVWLKNLLKKLSELK